MNITIIISTRGQAKQTWQRCLPVSFMKYNKAELFPMYIKHSYMLCIFLSFSRVPKGNELIIVNYIVTILSAYYSDF